MKPVPVNNDPDTGGFFAAAADGNIAICRCGSCDAVLHLPRPYCSAWGSSETVWREVSPKGSIYTWTAVEHAASRAFPAPYTVALVELDELPGVRLLSYFDGVHDFEPGAPVRAVFDDVRDGVVVPQWEPVSRSEDTAD